MVCGGGRETVVCHVPVQRRDPKGHYHKEGQVELAPPP